MIKIQYFFLILGLTGLFLVYGEGNQNARCVDPEESYLSKIYLDYETTFRKYEEIVYKTKAQERKRNSTYVYKIPRETLFENTECLMSSRKTFEISKKSLCPWKTEIKYRENRYPFYKLENKCTCSKCTLVGDEILDTNNFGCVPVTEVIPVLVRGKCGPDGYYIWEASLEESNMYCTCSFSASIVAV
ncbi:unnamed protein product [Brachionus calyciflorus]|uniref:Uncharacterized protein n=1 Tax=Brachionus calyciflorus TaxID=104777 RepID=A0A813XRG3_9BILA|nr:unnamed protein product [Brachionus calyciflorus]